MSLAMFIKRMHRRSINRFDRPDLSRYDAINMEVEPELTAADFDAADIILGRLRSEAVPQEGVRENARTLYASLHAQYGPDKFALRFGLRAPRNNSEELEALFFTGQINEDEYKKRFGAHATRPVDRPMLEKFFSEHEAALEKYSEVLVKIVEITTDQHDPYPADRREREVTTAIGNLRSKYDMFSTELMTVSEFLTLVQSDRHEPIACGDLTADSAHWLSALAFSQTEKAWESCKSIAHRSATDASYLYSTTATDLFYKTWIEPKKLPRPNDLASLMRSERVKALMVYDKRATLQESASNVAKAVQPIHFDDFSGHQFERLVFAFLLRTEKWRTLEWYGQSGSDGGRDIWGERDDGKTVCTLCANWKALTASKIIDDLNKIACATKGSPDVAWAVCGGSVSAATRDKVKEHAKNIGIAEFHIWSGQEFEERLRRDAQALLKRFVNGEAFPSENPY
ncbi:MAG: hypothetical protein JWM57_1473 [Phycisphaerales bacterium]|nr:hypothetical protein [Phycisphaerales bacterium]